MISCSILLYLVITYAIGWCLMWRCHAICDQEIETFLLSPLLVPFALMIMVLACAVAIVLVVVIVCLRIQIAITTRPAPIDNGHEISIDELIYHLGGKPESAESVRFNQEGTADNLFCEEIR